MKAVQLPSGLLVPVSPLSYKDRVARKQELRNEYLDAHRCCPQCGSLDHIQTCFGCLGDKDHNRSECVRCDWVGIVHDRVPQTKE